MRMVNIGFNVQTSSTIESLQKVNTNLKNIKKTVDEINKTKLNLGIDNKALNSASRATDKVATSIERLRESARGLNEAFAINPNGLNNMQSQLVMVGQSLRNINPNERLRVQNDTIDSYMKLYAVVTLLKTGFSEFMKLEDATYNLGVVAQMSEAKIADLRKTMVNMGQDVPIKITEITKAMDDTMRTGKDYAQALNLVTEASKLAVASGESLSDTMGIVNKIMVALKINADNPNDLALAMQNLHATSVYTATDLAGLGESAKQWVGAVGVLGETTTKSGEELNQYRLKLMETGNAFSGILANMGRASEQQGTTIREFFTKLVKADKSAEEMLDANLKRVNARVDEQGNLMKKDKTGGSLLSSKAIQTMALEDATKAVNLMSQLTTQGMIDMETMIKVFNGRYGLVVTNMLRTINGDYNEYNKSIIENNKLLEDSAIQQKNLNVQWADFKNLLFASGSQANVVLTGILYAVLTPA